MGLGYDKIYACLNDCMLFWNENAEKDNCSVCGSSRWSNEGDDTTNATSKTPTKILRYLALKPRHQRMFMCPETVVEMRSHDSERPNDGNLRHLADG